MSSLSSASKYAKSLSAPDFRFNDDDVVVVVGVRMSEFDDVWIRFDPFKLLKLRLLKLLLVVFTVRQLFDVVKW
jgi:hypothetical protein